MPDSPSVPAVSPVLRGMRLGQHVLFGLLLAVGAIRALSETGHFVAMLVGVLAFAGWYVLGMWLAPRMRHASSGRRYGAAWLAVLGLGWVALTVASSEFSWVAFSLFLLASQLLRWVPAIATVVVLTAVVVAVQLHAGGGSVPAKVTGPVIGALVATGMALAYRRLTAENEQRRRLVQELLAAQEDLVAAQDQLATAQRESGALAERARLARDIHDTLAQGFSSILLLARAGLAQADGTATPRRTLLGQIESTAAENLEEARRVVHALAPADLDAGSPLTAALGRLLDRLAEQTDVVTDLVVDSSGAEPEPLPTTYDVALLRLAQSALANVRQHARAQHATVTVTFADDAVTVDVVDDGVGFDPDSTAGSSGFGLRAMRARLAELGGSVRVESAPGEGTAVVARLPLQTGVRQ